MPDLADLPPGDHGFHVHVNPDCGPGAGPDGLPAAGLAAGGHYDPANSGKHLGPRGEGHKGDLPALQSGCRRQRNECSHRAAPQAGRH